MATMPAACGVDVVTAFGQVPSGLRGTLQGPCVLASGAPTVLNSMPDEAVVSLDTIVLLMMFTFNESRSEIPAPSQPATLSVMMLLVTVTAYQSAGVVGKVSTSVPLTPMKAMPPPLPLSAALPWTRFALMTRPGPAPSDGPTGGLTRQSWSGAGHSGSESGAPMTSRPPPLVAMVGFAL